MTNPSNSTWRDALAAYLAAHARHEDAERGYHRAGRVLEKLLKRRQHRRPDDCARRGPVRRGSARAGK